MKPTPNQTQSAMSYSGRNLLLIFNGVEYRLNFGVLRADPLFQSFQFSG